MQHTFLLGVASRLAHVTYLKNPVEAPLTHPYRWCNGRPLVWSSKYKAPGQNASGAFRDS